MSEGEQLLELGEFGLIERIAAQVRNASGVILGIGDDCAAIEPTAGLLTLTTADMLVEGVHFDLAFCDPLTLGRKALAVNLSDIAAMGGNPRHFLLALAIPASLSLEFIDSFIAGVLARANQFKVSLIGGDTCASLAGLVIAITAMGEQAPAKIVQRAGAKVGDLIFVTGTLGDAALGLELLRRGKRGGEAIARHLDPTPRVVEGVALAEAKLPTAMIDVSDGLLADLGHILDRSKVGARLQLAAIPLSAYFLRSTLALAVEPNALALAGGEDYELLFTAPPDRKDDVVALLTKIGTPVSIIGEITAGPGLVVIAADGSDYRVSAHGYNHFARR